jgi:hypothetical protein
MDYALQHSRAATLLEASKTGRAFQRGYMESYSRVIKVVHLQFVSTFSSLNFLDLVN